MSQGIKISQLAPAPSITDNDSIPFSRGGIETFRIPANIFVTAASNIGLGSGQLFSTKTNITPTTLQFRTLSASGESISVATVGNTVVISASGQNPLKRTLTGDSTTTTWPLAPFNSVNAANYRIDIDGVLQEAFVDYNISNNNLVFTAPPLSASKIVIVSSNNVKLNEAVIVPNSITNEMFTDGCINTTELSSSFYNNASKYLVLPSVSAVSALDVTAPQASVSYTNDTKQLYFKNQNIWVPITGRLGSMMRPAPNAQAIVDAGDSLGDGAYWIDSAYGPVLTFCDMVNGAYMLVASIVNSGDSAWVYGSTNWSSRGIVLNERVSSRYFVSPNALNTRNPLYEEFSVTTGFRMCLGNKNNALIHNTSGVTARQLLAVNTNTFTSFGRTAWINWFNTGLGRSDGATIFANQPNCNTEGFNLRFGTGHFTTIRFGIAFNNENECLSCDSAIGLGGTVATGSFEAGGATWSPNSVINTGVGYIFVK